MNLKICFFPKFWKKTHPYIRNETFVRFWKFWFLKKFWNFSKISFFFQNFRKKQVFKFNYNCQFLKDCIHSNCWDIIWCSKNTSATKNFYCTHVRARFWYLKMVKNGKIMFLYQFLTKLAEYFGAPNFYIIVCAWSFRLLLHQKRIKNL